MKVYVYKNNNQRMFNIGKVLYKLKEVYPDVKYIRKEHMIKVGPEEFYFITEEETKKFFTGRHNGQVRVIDAETLKQLKEFEDGKKGN